MNLHPHHLLSQRRGGCHLRPLCGVSRPSTVGGVVSTQRLSSKSLKGPTSGDPAVQVGGPACPAENWPTPPAASGRSSHGLQPPHLTLSVLDPTSWVHFHLPFVKDRVCDGGTPQQASASGFLSFPRWWHQDEALGSLGSEIS